MHLSPNDIDYIRYDLKKRGVAHPSLLEEMVDHVCCEVELEMKQGTAFKQAYEKVLREVSPPSLTDLQNKTIQSENYNTLLMFNNNLKMMLRNIKKHRIHTMINIVGLALGLACFIVISLYVRHELSYDKMFTTSSSTYRVTMSSTVGRLANFTPTSYPTLGPEIAERFPGIRQYARIINYKYSRMVPTFRFKENVFYEEKVIFADSTFFNLFDFTFLEGNPEKALVDPNSVVITESIARKYFGDESALGKHLDFNVNTSIEVTGVIKDVPSTTHLQFDFVIPMSNIANSGIFRSAKVLDGWDADWFWTYVIIPNASDVATIEAGLNKLATEKIPDAQKENNIKFYIQPLKDVHLHSSFDYNTDLTPNGDIKNLYIFISVGILVLLISAINFINITMATATQRYKEIGISKVLGALKSQLRLQFLAESVAICLTALFLSFILLHLMLPMFSNLMGVPLTISLTHDAPLLLAITLFTILVGVLSGAYPAFFVSSFEPQRVLKGVWKPGQGGASFRKVLVGVQIAISIFLIIGTVVIFEQLRFIQNKSLGYDKDQVIMLTVRGTNIVKGYYNFKEKLLAENSIVNVSSVSEPIGREVQFMSFVVEGQENTQFLKILNVTHDFVRTMGLDIVKGRDFSRENSTDSMSGFLINESAARAFGWSDPVGKALDHSWRPVRHGSVIGVVKDFNFEPLQKQIDPIVIWFGGPFWYVAVKTQQGKSAEALAVIEREWKRLEPEKPLAFQFLDQSIQHVYEKEQRLSNVFLVFAIISIFTAVLGLYGLISFIAEQRLTEIGIRKVMGASVKSILYLFSREYVLLVIISFVVSAPLSYLIINRWLESFAFRIPWNPLYFMLGFLISGLIVVSTVVFKAIKAAQSNPAEVLRTE